MERRRITHLSAGHLGAPLAGGGAQRGASLAELLISSVFLAVLMAISYSFTRAAFTSVRVQEARSDTQEVLLMAIDLLTRELRLAGFSAAAQPVIAVRAAGAEYVEVATDFDGDGASNGSNEVVAYSYNQNKRELARATGGASPQPVVRNVPPGGVQFAFYDAAGAAIATVDQMPLTDRRRIHRIDVTLKVEVPETDGAAAPAVATVSSSICLRNQ